MKEACGDEQGSAEWEVGDNDPASVEKAFCLALEKWPTKHKTNFKKDFRYEIFESFGLILPFLILISIIGTIWT